jgi:hypothetical protein
MEVNWLRIFLRAQVVDWGSSHSLDPTSAEYFAAEAQRHGNTIT